MVDPILVELHVTFPPVPGIRPTCPYHQPSIPPYPYTIIAATIARAPVSAPGPATEYETPAADREEAAAAAAEAELGMALD